MACKGLACCTNSAVPLEGNFSYLDNCHFGHQVHCFFDQILKSAKTKSLGLGTFCPMLTARQYMWLKRKLVPGSEQYP